MLMYLKCSGIVLDFFYKNGWPPCFMQIRHKKSKKVNQQEIESKHIIKVSEQNKKKK